MAKENGDAILESIVDSLVDSSKNIEVFAEALMALGSNTAKANAVMPQVADKIGYIVPNLNTFLEVVKQFNSLKGDIPRDIDLISRGDFEALAKYSKEQIAQMKKGLQMVFSEFISNRKGSGNISKEMEAFNRELTKVFKNLQTNIAKAQKNLEAINSFFAPKGSKPTISGKAFADSKLDYGGAVTSMFKGAMSTNIGEKMVQELMKQLSAKDLVSKIFTFPASTSGKYHNTWSDLAVHSADIIAQFLDIPDEKELDKQLQLVKKKYELERAKFTKTGLWDEKTQFSALDLAYRELVEAGIQDPVSALKKTLMDPKAMETFKLSAILHDIGKAAGQLGLSKGGVGTAQGGGDTHPEVITQILKEEVSRAIIDALPEEVRSQARDMLDSAIKAAQGHHSPISNKDVDQAVITALLKGGDAYSARNLGYKLEGMYAIPIDSHSSPLGTDQISYNLKALSTLNPAERFLQTLWRATGLSAGPSRDAAVSLLRELGIPEYVYSSTSNTKEGLSLLHWARGAGGSAALSITDKKNALESILAYNKMAPGETDYKMFGAAIAKADPALAAAFLLNNKLLDPIKAELKGAKNQEAVQQLDQISRALNEFWSAVMDETVGVSENIASMGSKADQILGTNPAAKLKEDLSGFSTMAKLTQQRDQTLERLAKSPTPRPLDQNVKSSLEEYRDKLRDLAASSLAKEVLGDQPLGFNKTEAIANSEALLRSYIERTAQSLASLSPEDQLTEVKAQRIAIENARTYRENVSGLAYLKEAARVEADIVKQAREAQKIKESQAKEALMAARAEETAQKTLQAIKDSEAISTKKRAEADTAIARAAEARAKAAREEATIEDKIASVKANRLRLEESLTADQRARVAEYAQSAAHAAKLSMESMKGDYDLSDESSKQIETRLNALGRAISEYRRSSADIAKEAERASQYYKAQLDTIKQAAQAQRDAINARYPSTDKGTEMIRAALLSSVDEEEKNRISLLQAEVEEINKLAAKRQESAAASIQARKEELELVKERLTLESELSAKLANEAIQRNKADISAATSRMSAIKAEIAERTKEDLIMQEHLKTQKMRLDIEEKINRLVRERSYLGSGSGRSSYDIQQAIGNRGLLSSVFRIIGDKSGVGPEASGLNWFGSARGEDNWAALKWGAKTTGWGVIGGLTGVMSSIQLIKQAIQNIKDYETAVVNLKRVWQDVPAAETLKALKDLNEIAIEYGETIQNVATVQEEWAKVGVVDADSLETLTETSILALNTSDIKDASNAVTYLNSALVQMGMSYEQAQLLLDSWNKLADATTADTSDFAEAYQKAAGYARAVGLDYTELNAIIATLIQNTGRSGAEVGTALRMMFSSIYKDKNLQIFKDLGIDVYETGETAAASVGKFKSYVEIIDEVAKKYQELQLQAGGFGEMTEDLNRLIGALGESRQRNYVMALLSSWNTTGFSSTGTSAINYAQLSMESAGYSAKKFEMTLDTLERKSQRLKASFTEAANAFGKWGLTDIMKGTVDFLSKIFDGFANLNPEIQEQISYWTMFGVTMATVNKILQQAFGTSLSKGLLNFIVNMGRVVKVVHETDKTFKDAAKSIAESSFTDSLGGILTKYSDLAEKLKNSDAFKNMAEFMSQTTGKSYDESMNILIDEQLARLGDLNAQQRIYNRLLEEYQAAQVGATAATAASTAAQTAEATATTVETSSTNTNTRATNENTASKTQNTVATDASATAAYKAATAKQAEAAANRAASAMAAKATLAQGLLSTAISIGIGLIIRWATESAREKKMLQERYEQALVTNAELKKEIKTISSLIDKHETLTEQRKKLAESGEDTLAIDRQLIEVGAAMADQAPALADYYDQENGLIIRNTEALREYLRYKQQILESNVSFINDLAGYQIDELQDKLEKNLEELNSPKGQIISKLLRALADYPSDYSTNTANDDFDTLLEKAGITREEFKSAGSPGTNILSVFSKKHLESDYRKLYVRYTEIEEENQKYLEKIAQLREQRIQAAASLFLDRNPEEALEVTLDRSVDAVKSATGRISGFISDLQENSNNIAEKVRNYLSVMLKKSPDSDQFKKAYSSLIDAGYGDLIVTLRDGSQKTLRQLGLQGEVKDNLHEISQALAERVRSDLLDSSSTLEQEIALVQDELTTHEEKLQEYEEVLSRKKTSLAYYQEALSNSIRETYDNLVADYNKAAKNISEGKVTSLDFDTYNRLKPILEKYPDFETFIQAYEKGTLPKSISEELDAAKLEYEGAIRAISDQITEIESESSQLKTVIAELRTKIVEGESELSSILLEDIDFGIPTYEGIARDIIEKILGAGTPADATDAVKELKDYFGSKTIEIEGAKKTISELTRDEILNNFLDIIYAINNSLVDSNDYVLTSLDYNIMRLQEYSKTVVSKFGDLGSGLFELIDGYALFSETFPELKAKIEEIGEADIIGYIGLRDKDAIPLEEQLEMAAQAISQIKDATYATERSVREGAYQLKLLFGDLEISGQLLGAMSEVQIYNNIDTITNTLSTHLTQRSKYAYDYAKAQLQIANTAVEQTRQMLNDTLDLMRILRAEGDTKHYNEASAFATFLQQILKTFGGNQASWRQVLDNLPEPGSEVSLATRVGELVGDDAKWKWLDEAMNKLENAIKRITNNISILQAIWSEDLTNPTYLSRALKLQEQLIDQYVDSINQLVELRSKISTEEDKYDEVTDKIESYTQALYEAYNVRSQLMRSYYTDSLTELESSLSRAINKIDLMTTKLRGFIHNEQELTIATLRLNTQLRNYEDQMATVSREIDRASEELKSMSLAAKNATSAFERNSAEGRINSLRKYIEELQNKLVELESSAEDARIALVQVFSTYLTDAYNKGLEKELENISDLRDEYQKLHDEKIKYLEEYLKHLEDSWKAEDDQRELADLEQEMALVQIRIRRLAGDTSQYGRKLLKEAQDELNNLQKQYDDKKRQMARDAIRDQIEEEREALEKEYDEKMKDWEAEERAINKHYKILLDNAEYFAQGLVDRYMSGQNDVLAYLTSESLLSKYREAAEAANAAYYAGLNLLSPSISPSDDYSKQTPGNLFGNDGSTKPSGTNFNPDTDYMALMLPLMSSLESQIKSGQYSVAQETYSRLQQLERQRNAKINSMGLDYAPTSDFQRTFWEFIQSGARIPTYHSGGVVGKNTLPNELSRLLGLGPKEALVKALEGEYMVPRDQMANLLKSIDMRDLLRLRVAPLYTKSSASSTNVDNSVTIDKVMNIENAVFSSDFDVDTLESVAGRYIRSQLSRRGITNPKPRNR